MEAAQWPRGGFFLLLWRLHWVAAKLRPEGAGSKPCIPAAIATLEPAGERLRTRDSHPRSKPQVSFLYSHNRSRQRGGKGNEVATFLRSGLLRIYTVNTYFCCFSFPSKLISQFLVESAREHDVSHFWMWALELFWPRRAGRQRGEDSRQFQGLYFLVCCCSVLLSVVHSFCWSSSLRRNFKKKKRTGDFFFFIIYWFTK